MIITSWRYLHRALRLIAWLSRLYWRSQRLQSPRH